MPLDELMEVSRTFEGHRKAAEGGGDVPCYPGYLGIDKDDQGDEVVVAESVE